MAAANTAPVFTARGDIQWSAILTVAANDYNGTSIENRRVWEANPENGGFCPAIRFKALGTNVASLARIFINNGGQNTVELGTPAAPTATPGTASVVSGATCTISGTTLTTGVVTPTGNHQGYALGMVLAGGSVALSTVITKMYPSYDPNGVQYTGTGANTGGTYEVSVSQTLSSTTLTATGMIYSTGMVAKVIALDSVGGISAVGAEVASPVSGMTGSSNSIVWSWTHIAGAVRYRIVVATATGKEYHYYEQVANVTVGSAQTWTQTQMPGYGEDDSSAYYNQILWGEIALPATTASATAPTPDVDYPINKIFPPGYEIYVGLATAVAAGWVVSGAGGAY